MVSGRAPREGEELGGWERGDPVKVNAYARIGGDRGNRACLGIANLARVSENEVWRCGQASRSQVIKDPCSRG